MLYHIKRLQLPEEVESDAGCFPEALGHSLKPRGLNRPSFDVEGLCEPVVPKPPRFEWNGIVSKCWCLGLTFFLC